MGGYNEEKEKKTCNGENNTNQNRNIKQEENIEELEAARRVLGRK